LEREWAIEVKALLVHSADLEAMVESVKENAGQVLIECFTEKVVGQLMREVNEMMERGSRRRFNEQDLTEGKETKKFEKGAEKGAQAVAENVAGKGAQKSTVKRSWHQALCYFSD